MDDKAMQEMAWVKQKFMMDSAIANGHGQCVNNAQIKVGLMSAIGYQDQPKTREITQALLELDQSMTRLTKAVDFLNDRTMSVQTSCPEEAGNGIAKAGMGSELARKLSMLALLISDQAKRLEDMERQIQL